MTVRERTDDIALLVRAAFYRFLRPGLKRRLRKEAGWLFDRPGRIRIDPAHPPVLIYQQGRVGSTSVFWTLSRLGLPNPIIHVHELSEEGIDGTLGRKWDALRTLWRTEASDPRARLFDHYTLLRDIAHYRSFRRLRRIIDAPAPLRWKIITHVRDSVEREISNYVFQCLPAQRGIDVFSHPFDPERGFALIRSDAADVLVFRLESLSASFSEAVREFLGVEGASLVDQNRAVEKPYAAIYAAFLDRLRLNPALCRRVYESKLCRHFYSDLEREQLLRRWTEGRPRRESDH
jgi:hypothetical protein